MDGCERARGRPVPALWRLRPRRLEGSQVSSRRRVRGFGLFGATRIAHGTFRNFAEPNERNVRRRQNMHAHRRLQHSACRRMPSARGPGFCGGPHDTPLICTQVRQARKLQRAGHGQPAGEPRWVGGAGREPRAAGPASRWGSAPDPEPQSCMHGRRCSQCAAPWRARVEASGQRRAQLQLRHHRDKRQLCSDSDAGHSCPTLARMARV